MLENLDTYEMAFWICAIIGTTMFLLKSLLSMVGGLDHDLDTSGSELSHEGSESSDVAFKLISINSIMGFIMMFGWIGLTCYKEMKLSGTVSILGASLAGLLTMYLVAKIFSLAHSMISVGQQFKIEETIGLVATVYQAIPANGRGQIQLTVAGLTRELDALAEESASIESFKNVTIISVVDTTTVLVKQI